MQRILAHAEQGDAAAAESVLDATVGVAPDLSQRLARATCPAIAAAAVRAGDFPRAGRSARRFALVEPDPVEGAKLVSWVASRRPNGAVPGDLGLLPGFSVRLLAGGSFRLR